MRKKILLSLLILFFTPFAFAQTDQLTLTTYYPAPFGMYQEMRVMGKLGVGTTNPANKLDVNGSASIGYASNVTAPTNGLVVSGKVGVGVTDVGALALDVFHGNALGAVARIGGPYYSTEFAKLDTSSGSSLYYGADIQALGSAAGPGWPGVGLRVNSANKAIIVDAGRVGIGTTNPAAGFHVKSQPGLIGSLDADAFFEGKVGIGSTKTYNAPLNVTDSTAWNPAAVIKKTGAGAGLGILHNDPASNVPDYKALYIYANNAAPYQAIYQEGNASSYFQGRIGIGVMSPQYSLDVGCSGSMCTESATTIKSSGTIATDGHLVVGSAINTSNAYINGYVQLFFSDGTVCDASRVGAIRLTPMPAGGGAYCPLQICYPGAEFSGGPGVYSWKGSCNPVYWNGVTPPNPGSIGIPTGGSIE